MKSIGNLGGTLYYKDIPIAVFKFDRGTPVKCDMLSDDKTILPFELMHFGTFRGIYEFFIDRPTPETRIGFNELLKETPIQYYDVERLLRYNHAQCIHDCFWIEQDDDNRCWDGSPLEGIGIPPNTDWNNIITSLKFKN